MDTKALSDDSRTAPTHETASAFTPGPWWLDTDKNDQLNVFGASDEWIALLPHCCVGTWEEQQKANARLIAAAPDLYEALKAMEETAMRLGLSRGEEGDTAWANALLAHFAALNQARAALAKAEGR